MSTNPASFTTASRSSTKLSKLIFLIMQVFKTIASIDQIYKKSVKMITKIANVSQMFDTSLLLLVMKFGALIWMGTKPNLARL